MKYLRFAIDGTIKWGLLAGDEVWVLSDAGYRGGTPVSDKPYKLPELVLLAPVEPEKIVCVGLNYLDHAEELKMQVPEEPIIFLKPPSSVTGTCSPVIYPRSSEQLDYEAELAVVIGRKAKNVSGGEALKYVFGYTCGNDVTARDLQRKDGQWTRAKSFDTFCPLGPWIETELEPGDLRLISKVNGVIKQDSRTSQMIFGVAELVSFVSHIMTLNPGDVIMTGTPKGVGSLNPGDEVIIEIPGIGSLVNWVEKEAE